jgi:hypothetical protein
MVSNRELAAHKMFVSFVVRILRDLDFSCCVKNKTQERALLNMKNVNHEK